MAIKRENITAPIYNQSTLGGRSEFEYALENGKLLLRFGKMIYFLEVKEDYIVKVKNRIDHLKDKNEIGFSEKDYAKSLIDFKISWNLFEEFCQTNGIKMLWSTWDELDNNNFKTFGFSENYIELADQEKMQNYFKDYLKNNELKDDDMNRRDDHYGTLYNRYWSDNFYKGVRARWEIK